MASFANIQDFGDYLCSFDAAWEAVERNAAKAVGAQAHTFLEQRREATTSPRGTRRLGQRQETTLPVTLLAGGGSWTTHLLDLSCTGCAIVWPALHVRHLRGTVLLRINLWAQPMLLRVRYVRCVSSRAMAFEFVDMRDVERLAVAELLDREQSACA